MPTSVAGCAISCLSLSSLFSSLYRSLCPLARRIYEMLQVRSRYAGSPGAYGISTRPALSELSGASCDGVTEQPHQR